ncbi:MAG: FkbM family methyltransferase [Alphaproteobacteria bacterium]|nr:FkbM family methyltransferase [Alphaproteobacteria bacterium]
MNSDSLTDDGNTIIEAFNKGQYDVATSKLDLWIQEYGETGRLPLTGHRAALYLARIAWEMRAKGLYVRLRNISYHQEFDNDLRAQANDIATMIMGGKTIQARQPLIDLVTTKLSQTTLMPGSWDVLKALRYAAMHTQAEELLPILDTRRFETSVFEWINLKHGPDSDIAVDGHGRPVFQMRSAGDCPICEIIVRTGAFEPTSMRLWRALVDSVDTAIDVGAHVGIYSLLAAAVKPGMAIHAFEPNPEAFARLNENIQLNGFQNISTYPLAVSDTAGEIMFDYMAADDGVAGGGVREISRVGSSSGREFTGGSGCLVETRPLDEVLPTATDQKLAIKIDTEGNEADVFTGMSNLISTNQPDILVETFVPEACRTISALIEPLGYHAYRVIEGSHTLLAMDTLMPAALDYAHNFNTLLTTRSRRELGDLLPFPCRVED